VVFLSTPQLQRVVNSCPRPFVLINERELSVLRRGLTKDGWKKSLYLQPAPEHHGIYVGAGLLSIANQWLDAEIVVPEAGCRQRHRELATAALSLALVYGIEKDRAYAEKAAQVLLEYAEKYHGGRAEGAPDMFENSVCEASWALPLAQAYDLIYYSRIIGDEDKEQIEQGLFRPVADRLSDWDVRGSAGAWRIAAVGVIGFSIKDADIVGYALEGSRCWMLSQLEEDGLMIESSISSHFDALSALVHLAEACHRTGINIYGFEAGLGKSLNAMFNAPLNYAYPSFRLPAIGDAPWHSFIPLDLYEIAFRRWSESSFAWVLKRGYTFGAAPINQDQRENIQQFMRTSFYAFLFGRDLPGKSTPPTFKSQDSTSLGLVCLRNGSEVMMTVNYGPHKNRGHLDKPGFTFYANDELLVADYGMPAREASAEDWYCQTHSHNTILVDGKSQDPAIRCEVRIRCYGSSFQGVVCEASDSYPGVTHFRRVAMLGNICLIVDNLISEEEHQYDWLFHCEGEPSLNENFEPIEGVFDDSHPAIVGGRAFRMPDELRVDWKCSNGDLAMAMWLRPGYGEFMLGTCPAETTDRKVPLLTCRQRCREAAFVTALVPTRPGEDVGVTREGSVIVVKAGDAVDYIHISRIGECDDDSFHTDARIGAVRTRGGEVYAVAIFRGSRLVWNNQLLLECPPEAQCVEVTFDDKGPRVYYGGMATGTLKLRTTSRMARINGIRGLGSTADGIAVFRITPQMIDSDESRPSI
ncbi:MAG: heparinase II/III family protein, partial [Armatimonadetes bacterium]|nr:heparinase II/III family protein [Armatimonadota bacterium]